jgi:hypothetical protein
MNITTKQLNHNPFFLPKVNRWSIRPPSPNLLREPPLIITFFLPKVEFEKDLLEI